MLFPFLLAPALRSLLYAPCSMLYASYEPLVFPIPLLGVMILLGGGVAP